MARRERLLDQNSDDPLIRFALDLRALRKSAGSPTYRALAVRAGFSVTTLAEAASGRGLPTLAVTRAYVLACGGDVREWERRWHGLAAARANADEAADRSAGGDPGAVAVAPYVGLAAFQPRDADRFFGRAELTAQLCARVAERRFVAVFGASGSGKSSLLRAGLVARWAGDGGRFVVLTPGEHPLHTYQAALADFSDVTTDVLVVVDQFEEVFTVCADEAERTQFIARLLAATERPDSNVRVVLGVRTDFYSHCVHDPGLAPELQHGQFVVCPMTTEQLRAAITRPASQAGAMVETALVTQIVADCTGQRGVLPLLSHALRETWQRRSGATLTLAGYQAAGGIVHAIAQTAELVYTSLGEAEQQLAKALFLRLVALGDGTEDTKRRITTAELDLTDERMVATLARLTVARLVTVDHDQLEITHEALIRHWPRLGRWLTEDRDGLRVHRQLTAATAGWVALRHDPAALYRGAQLAVARQWAIGRDVLLTAKEREFLATSARAEHTTRMLARKRTRRLRVLVALLSVLVVVAGSSAVVAVRSMHALTRQRDQVEAQGLVDRAAAEARSDPELAAQLSVAAYRLEPDEQTRSAVLDYGTSVHAWAVRTPGSPQALSPNARLLATDSYTAIHVWTLDARTHHARVVGSIAHPAGKWVTYAEFSPDGTRLRIDLGRAGAQLWSTADPARPVLLSRMPESGPAVFGSDQDLLVEGSRDTVLDLADPRHPTVAVSIPDPTGSSTTISQDGRTLAQMENDRANRLRLWDIGDRPARPAWRTTVPGDPGDVLALAGSLLAVTTDTGAILLWRVTDVHAPVYLGTVPTRARWIIGIALSPDGHELAVSQTNEVQVWDLSRPASPHLITTERDNTTDPRPMLAFRSDTMLVGTNTPADTGTATDAEDTTTYWWDLPAPGLSGRSVDGAINPAFSPDGHTMATVDALVGDTQLWDVSEPTLPVPSRTLPGTGVGQAVVFAPHGQLLATTSGPGVLWDDGRHPQPLATVPDVPLTFSPNGRMLATTGGVWDVGHPAHRHRVLRFRQSQTVGTVAFSPNSGLLAVSDWNANGSSVVLWNTSDPDRPRPVGRLPVPATQLVFLPDSSALATITFSGLVQLWDVGDPAAPRQIGHLSGRPAQDQQLLVGPDGRTLAIAGTGSTTGLWDVADPGRPSLLAVLTDATPEAFDPTGGVLAVLTTDGSIQLRDVDTTRVIDRICQSAPTLDPANWRQYAPNVPYRPVCPIPTHRR